MQAILELINTYKPDSMLPLAAGMLVAGMVVVVYSVLNGRTERSGVQKRLRLVPLAELQAREGKEPQKKPDAILSEKTLKKAQDFYAKGDPDEVARLRAKLIQAGYMDPKAPGYFFVARFVLLAFGFLAVYAVLSIYFTDMDQMKRWTIIAAFSGFSYFSPNVWLAQQTRAKIREYKNGFPDFMDLMIVCADAGMSLEAAIERVSREISKTYPSLSQNLSLVSIELRAGRVLDDTMKALSDRLGLDEVRSFATLLQQSKELGTSLSAALRVFSDEMRHKRMSAAEEKAHALPAKMSVPVTMCILPVVLLVAVIPVIAKFTAGQ
ncbi:MAG: type II secretion system F family protein [Rhizobiaceae bacterium]